MTVCESVNLGPPCVAITGVRANDKNEMLFTVEVAGAPLDLTGIDLAASARKKKTDPGPAPIVAVITIIDAEAGLVNVRWPGDQVAEALGTASAWKGVWDIEGTEGTDPPITYCEGTFEAGWDVTR